MPAATSSPPPEHVILRALLAQDSGFVSGSALAAQLGMSRVAVWQHMEKLRSQGFTFKAVRSRGYQLTGRPAALNAMLVSAHLAAREQPATVIVVDEVDSTNDEAARRLAAGQATPFVVLARRQLRGRGRFGRAWHSDSDANLYASFAFRPQLAPGRMQTFTLWMGVNLCELVANFCRAEPGLKWPNDLLLDGRKAGGILTEARIDADQIRDLVFGLGLNINSTADTRPGELAQRAISLSEHVHAPLDLNRFTAALIGRVILAYERFVDGDYVRNFPELWHRYDVLRGRPIALNEGDRRHAGTALGIDDEGALLLRDETSRTHRFRAGEVTLEKSDAVPQRRLDLV